MDIYLFKKDLDTFSKSDIQSLAKMYGFIGDLNDLRWQIALRHYQSRKQMITGDPNIDKQILLEMDPRTFARTCRTDKTMHGLCKEVAPERVENVKAELRKHRDDFNKLIKRFDFEHYQGVDDLDLMNLDLIPNHVNMIMEHLMNPDVSQDDQDTMEKVALLLAQLPETTPQDLARLFGMFYGVHRDEFVGNPNLDLNLIDLANIDIYLTEIIEDFSLGGLKQYKIDGILSNLTMGAPLESFIEFLENIDDGVQIKNEYVRLFLEDVIYNYVNDRNQQREEYMPKVRKIIAVMLQKDPSIQWKNFVDDISLINDDKITKMVYMPNIKGLRMFSK